MNLIKLNKKREKRRQKILAEFGYENLKLCEDNELKEIRRFIGQLEENYIMGAGSCSWSVKKTFLTPRKHTVEFLKTLPYVKDVIISDLEKEEKIKEGYIENFEMKFHRPIIEIKEN